MKKIFALVVAAILSALAAVSSAFAENTLHIGAYFPLSNFDLSHDDETTGFFSSGVGGSLDYIHIANSGFTFKVGLGAAYTKEDDFHPFGENESSGFSSYDLHFGFGGSFIHNQRMTLSLTGDFGFKIQGMFGTAGSNLSELNGVDAETDLTSLLFYIGPEISYTFRFTDHIGLFANFGIFYNIGESTYSISINGMTPLMFEDKTFTTKGFSFQPKLGLAITF